MLAPQLAALVARTQLPLLQPIYDLEVPRMAVGRVALLGDAAFVARPHAGTGVTKAARDAECLADALTAAPAIDAALAAYDRERTAFGAALVARARQLGPISKPAPPQPPRRAATARSRCSPTTARRGRWRRRFMERGDPYAACFFSARRRKSMWSWASSASFSSHASTARSASTSSPIRS